MTGIVFRIVFGIVFGISISGRAVIRVFLPGVLSGRIFLLVLHPFPEAVVIVGEDLRELHLLEVIPLSFYKILVDPLCSQNMDLLLQSAVPFLTVFRRQLRHCPVFHRINDRIHSDIAGQIPEFPVLLFPCGEHMAEDTVEDHMQIGAVQKPRAVHVELEEIIGVKADHGGIRPDKGRGQIHDPSQAVQGRAQKAHGEIELRPRRIQYSFSHFVQFNSVSHTCQSCLSCKYRYSILVIMTFFPAFDTQSSPVIQGKFP